MSNNSRLEKKMPLLQWVANYEKAWLRPDITVGLKNTLD
jgi:hypothetical protein